MTSVSGDFNNSFASFSSRFYMTTVAIVVVIGCALAHSSQFNDVVTKYVTSSKRRDKVVKLACNASQTYCMYVCVMYDVMIVTSRDVPESLFPFFLRSQLTLLARFSRSARICNVNMT